MIFFFLIIKIHIFFKLKKIKYMKIRVHLFNKKIVNFFKKKIKLLFFE